MITTKIIIRVYQLDNKEYNLVFAVGDLVLVEIEVNADQYKKLLALGITEIKKPG